MKNITQKFIGISILATLLFACSKNNDWNLNGAPNIALDNIEVTHKIIDKDAEEGVLKDTTYFLQTAVKGSNSSIIVDTATTVVLHFMANSGNKIEQISFHDGTWGDNIYLVHGADTITATPPHSKYYVNEKEASFQIKFDRIDAQTIFSMLIIDEHSMSSSFNYIINTKQNEVTQ